MTIRYVRTGEKLHLSANTLNTIADHINNAPSISAGKPIKGGGGGGVPVVQDNTADIFKIKQGVGRVVNVSGGNIINGLTVVSCNGVSLTIPASSTRYIVLSLTYSNGAYSASITDLSTATYPTSGSQVYSLTLGKVVTDNNNIVTIEQWHYPNDVIVVGRWS